MSAKQRLHRIFQRLLFLWVRVEPLPNDLTAQQLKQTPVLYVLAARGLSDLLVLEYMTRQQALPDPLARLPLEGVRHHSVYSIASRSPLSDWILRQEKHSPMLEDLITLLKKNDNIDITVVPVSVFWGRAIARQRHWLNVLFADTWAVAGKLRKFFTILFNGRATTLIYSPAQSLRSLCQQADNSAEKLNDLLKHQLHQQREATFGPEIENINTIITRVVQSQSVQQSILDNAEQNKAYSIKKGRRRATKYCREIFSNCTQISQEIMKRLLNTFWNRFYCGIEVSNIEPVKRIALTHQLIYVPCHRSHVDYLLLSYVIFKQGLALPYIAAGINLNMPVIGRLLRGGGAFFIRRSFRDNPLYGAVLTEYLRELVDLGVPIEYFIEGGRSRTGRLLKPKLGMLSITVDAWIRSQKKPLAFIPVYIGYEKLIEGRSYVGELHGDKKEKESLFTSIKSILFLKGNFGKVTASFGTPLKLENLLSEHAPEWRHADIDSLRKQRWFRLCVTDLSLRIMLEINRATVINPVNLIATALLATPRQSMDELDLLAQCDFYQHMITSLPMLDGIMLQDNVSATELHRIQQQGLIDTHEHELGNIIYLKPQNAVLMSYYRNNSLHTLIIPSLIACCFLNVRGIEQDKLIGIVRYVYPFLASELHLQWEMAELTDFIPQIIDFLVSRQVLTRTKNTLKRPERSDAHFLILTRMAHIAQPILERYYMTFVVLWESATNPLKEHELEQRCHLVAQKISMIYGINSPDFFDRQLFGHFIDTLFELDFIERDDDDKLILQKSFNQVNTDIKILLSLEVRSTILQLLNTSHHRGREYSNDDDNL